REVKKRVQAGWGGWRRVSGVRQKGTSKREREGLHDGSETSCVVWLEAAALTKRQEAELEVAELNMLRFLLEVTRMDKIKNKNKYIDGLETKRERQD
ncbi:hypothetical protein LDENG_00066670, partial [Lucifuga dentata]